jgi:hypothetical protein
VELRRLPRQILRAWFSMSRHVCMISWKLSHFFGAALGRACIFSTPGITDCASAGLVRVVGGRRSGSRAMVRRASAIASGTPARAHIAIEPRMWIPLLWPVRRQSRTRMPRVPLGKLTGTRTRSRPRVAPRRRRTTPAPGRRRAGRSGCARPVFPTPRPSSSSISASDRSSSGRWCCATWTPPSSSRRARWR